MKQLTLFLFISIILTSCKEREPKQYSLTTKDIQKLEELTCYLLNERYSTEKDLNFVRYLQSGVTNLGDQLYLSESANSSMKQLSHLEEALLTLKKVGVTCNGQDVELSEEQIKNRMEFLNAIKINIENNSTWRGGLKIRSIEDINAQTDYTAQLSSQLK